MLDWIVQALKEYWDYVLMDELTNPHAGMIAVLVFSRVTIGI